MKRLLTLALTLALLLPLAPQRANAVVHTPFAFGIAGDIGNVKTDTFARQSLLRLANTTGIDFFIAAGDLQYGYDGVNLVGDPTAWCNEFKAHYNNIIIVAGNHDTGEANQNLAPPQYPDGNVDFDKFVNGCPFSLSGVTWVGSGVDCNLGPGYVRPSCYGREFYFDYKPPNPQVRFVFISPLIANITGQVSQPDCPIQGICPGTKLNRWLYQKGDAHYNWLNNTIQGAFSAGIPYVFVVAHKVCVSAGTKTCVMRNNHYYDSVNKKTDADLWNLITSNNNGGRVSMFLGAHDHDYQRSKQMSVRRNSGDIGCPGPLEGKARLQYNGIPDSLN